MPKFLITKCLTWNELSPEQRAKIIDKNRNIRSEILSNEDIIWEFSEAGEMIADAGFLNPDVYYSYSCSQGDGACFDCEIFNWELLLEDLDIPHKQFFIKYLEEGTNISYGIARPNASFAYHYFHEKCRRFYIDAQYGWPPRVCEIYAKIEAHIEKKRLGLSQKAFSLICDAIDWLQSDECITEELECRDWYYNEETLCVEDDTKLLDMPCKEGKRSIRKLLIPDLWSEYQTSGQPRNPYIKKGDFVKVLDINELLTSGNIDEPSDTQKLLAAGKVLQIIDSILISTDLWYHIALLNDNHTISLTDADIDFVLRKEENNV